MNKFVKLNMNTECLFDWIASFLAMTGVGVVKGRMILMSRFVGKNMKCLFDWIASFLAMTGAGVVKEKG